MNRRAIPWIAPVILIAGALVAGFFNPMLMIASLALAMATFYGALSAGIPETRSSRGMIVGLITGSIAFVPARVIVYLVQGRAVDWQRQATLFGFALALVVVFFVNRTVALRTRRG